MLLLLLFSVAVFCWLVVRAVRAGMGPFLLWFAGMTGGLLLLLWATVVSDLLTQVLAYTLVGFMVGYPAWRLLRRKRAA